MKLERGSSWAHLPATRKVPQILDAICAWMDPCALGEVRKRKRQAGELPGEFFQRLLLEEQPAVASPIIVEKKCQPGSMWRDCGWVPCGWMSRHFLMIQLAG